MVGLLKILPRPRSSEAQIPYIVKARSMLHSWEYIPTLWCGFFDAFAHIHMLADSHHTITQCDNITQCRRRYNRQTFVKQDGNNF